jgi:hypothetical protein
VAAAPTAAGSTEAAASDASAKPAPAARGTDPTPDNTLAYCIACGHANVAEARFCNRCGSAMPTPVTESVPAASQVPLVAPLPARPPTTVSDVSASERPSSEPGRRALWLVALGLFAVVAIYIGTTLGGRGRPRMPADAGPVPGTLSEAPALDPGAVGDLALPESLRADASAAAALVQGARTANTAAAWDDAGRIYLDLTRRAAPELRPTLARQAVAAFTRSLEVEENPDVRTRMVSAYRYDPEATMQPVLELQRVLSSTPNHPEANFQMGELRLQISRLDSAVVSFERAAANAPEGSVLQRDAVMMAERAREALAQEPAARPSGGG